MFWWKTKNTPSFAPTCVFLYDGLCAFNFWVHPPTWVDFWLFMALKSNQCFLLNIFCFRFIWRTADSLLAVLDFFLAHRTVPYVPCTSRHGLFAPRDSARSAAPLVGEAWKAEPYKGGSSSEENPLAWLWGKRHKPCGALDEEATQLPSIKRSS